MACVNGKLLLKEALKSIDCDEFSIKNLKYSKYGRPFLNSVLDFNISHSGMYVICAIGKGLNIGVDIEKNKDIDINNFTNIFTDQEYKLIHDSVDSQKAFYEYWTKKESVMKANGRGLSIPIHDIKIEEKKNYAIHEDSIWYLKKIKIDNYYSSHLATNYANVNISLEYRDFYN